MIAILKEETSFFEEGVRGFPEQMDNKIIKNHSKWNVEPVVRCISHKKYEMLSQTVADAGVVDLHAGRHLLTGGGAGMVSFYSGTPNICPSDTFW